MSNPETKRSLPSRETLNKFSAATLLGLTTFWGVDAYNSHVGYVEADQLAVGLDSRGDPRAAELRESADRQKLSRDMSAAVAAFNAVGAVGMALGARENDRNRRRQESGISSDPTNIPTMDADYPYK